MSCSVPSVNPSFKGQQEVKTSEIQNVDLAERECPEESGWGSYDHSKRLWRPLTFPIFGLQSRRTSPLQAIPSPAWLISPYFRDSIDCSAHTACFPVCLQGKTSSYCLGPCHLGLSSWTLLQLLYPVHPVSSKGALGFHSSCFAHRSQVRCEFLVTFCCGDCKIKIQLLKKIRGETDKGPCLNHTSRRQFYQWHSQIGSA